MEYTIIVLSKWSVHGNDVKEIFHNHNLKWNPEKIVKLNNSDLKETLNKFQLTLLDFNINENDVGSSGVWENDNNAIKIIRIENNDDVILIYKNISTDTEDKKIEDKESTTENKLYVDFIKKCKDISSIIRKIVDDKITFEKRINIDLFEKLNDVNEEKKMKIKNFIIRTETLGGFSEKFKKKWIKCIEDS